MTTELETLVSQLSLARTTAEKAREVVRLMTRNFQESPEFVAAASVSVEYGANEAALDAAIREYAIKQYVVDGEKHPHEKIEIKKSTTVEIPNPEAAREWSFLNFRPALKLDARVFEKAAKDGSIPADLVRIVEEPKVYIASKL